MLGSFLPGTLSGYNAQNRCIFAAGMACLMLLVSDLNWSKELIFPLIGLWAVNGGPGGLARYRREKV